MIGGLLKKKRHLKEDVDLNITAMASIFTVILVFLLKSFATDVSPIDASADVALPELSTAQSIENSFKIEVTKNSVLFEGQETEKLANYAADASELDADGTLRNLAKVIHDAQELKSEKGDKPLITVFADKTAPVSIVQRAIASAAKNGLNQVQMVVVHEDK